MIKKNRKQNYIILKIVTFLPVKHDLNKKHCINRDQILPLKLIFIAQSVWHLIVGKVTSRNKKTINIFF